MQIADLHYSVSQGQCKDTSLSPCHGGDAVTENLITRMLDTEKPDLVVFTGDQVSNQRFLPCVSELVATAQRARH